MASSLQVAHVDQHKQNDKPRGELEESSQEGAAAARRRLLKVLVYSPPAIVGTLLISNEALAQPASCPPNTGCQPNCGPSACGPSVCNPAG